MRSSLLVLLLSSLACGADTCSTVTLDAWVSCRLEQVAAAKINQRDSTKNADAPAVVSGSTSLVDQSSTPDLAAFALSLASLGKGGAAGQAPFSFSSTPYALLAATNGRSLDPYFYSKYRAWRRFSFTFGHEQDDDEHNGPANIFAGKLLLVNRRDATDSHNQAHLKAVSDALKLAAMNFGQTRREITDYIFQVLGPSFGLNPDKREDKESFLNGQLSDQSLSKTLALLKEEHLAQIDRIVERHIDAEVALSDATTTAIESIRRAPQLAISFSSKIRPHQPIDEYRAELTWDYGLYRRMNWTANLSYDYRNVTQIGADVRGGRFAQQFEYQLTREQNLKREPIKVAISMDGKWQTRTSPVYQIHGKVTVPILTGVSLPLSVSWASRTNLINESFVKGNFGLTFDVAKLAGLFQQHP